jgi:CBS domain-containing protein
MNAGNVMTRQIVSVTPETSVPDMAQLMLKNRISGLPVIDGNGNLVGIVTEGDGLRRVETDTKPRRRRWVEFLMGPDQFANEYVHAHGRKVSDVMTSDPVTVTEDTPLYEVVHLMEKRRIKRIPVLRGQQVVGIVSRADLLRALASTARDLAPSAIEDAAIRNQVLAELGRQSWGPANLINVTVRDGIVDLWGVVLAGHQREAATVAAENIAGVKAVRSHLAWVEPISGMVFDDPSDEAVGKKAVASESV